MSGITTASLRPDTLINLAEVAGKMEGREGGNRATHRILGVVPQDI